MSPEARELLRKLCSRDTIAFVADQEVAALHELHDAGYVAIQGRAALATDEGRLAYLDGMRAALNTDERKGA